MEESQMGKYFFANSGGFVERGAAGRHNILEGWWVFLGTLIRLPLSWLGLGHCISWNVWFAIPKITLNRRCEHSIQGSQLRMVPPYHNQCSPPELCNNNFCHPNTWKKIRKPLKTWYTILQHQMQTFTLSGMLLLGCENSLYLVTLSSAQNFWLRL